MGPLAGAAIELVKVLLNMVMKGTTTAGAGMVRENMEISESVIMKQADQKMYENKKVHGESPQWIVPAGLFVVQ